MEGVGQKKGNWNKFLLDDVIAPSYADLLQSLAQSITPTQVSQFYALWPTPEYLIEPWASMAKTLYSHLHDNPILFTEAKGGKWISPKDSFFISSEVPTQVKERLIQE